MTALVTVNRAPLTAALKTALAAVIDTEVGKPPLDAADLTRYVILYPIDGGAFQGPPTLPESDADLCYQTTSVAVRGDQLEQVADLVRRTMMTAVLAPSGLTVMARWCVSAGGMDADTALMQVAERFYFSVTTT